MIYNLPASVTLDMPADDYHALAALGSSGLKVLKNQTPLHFWSKFLDPDREQADKKHFRIGRAWHCAVFEPEEFANRYTSNHDAHPATKRAVLLQAVIAGEVDVEKLAGIPDEIKLSSKEGKQLAADIEAAGDTPVAKSDLQFVLEWLPRLQGKDVLQQSQIEGVRKMAALARDLPISKIVFGKLPGFAEISIVTTFCGVPAKIRPDYAVLPCDAFPNGLIIDGKSTTDAGDGFARQSWNLDYGLQAAYYTAIFQQEFRTKERPPFLWLAQEKETPFAARYYAAGVDLVAYFDKMLPGLVGLYQHGIETGIWLGYPTAVQDLTMPGWAQKEIDAAAVA